METPTPATRKRSSTDATNTDFSSVFDDDPPLSNSVSPVSDEGREHKETQEPTSQGRPEPTVSSTDASAPVVVLDSQLYGTAASQRPGRVRKAPDLYPGLVPDTPPKSEDELSEASSPADAGELTPAHTEDEEAPAPTPTKTSKGRKLASSAKIQPKSATKKPRVTPAKSAAKKLSKATSKQPLTTPDDEQHSAPAVGRSGKRKHLPAVPEASPPTPSKRAKTTTAASSPLVEDAPNPLGRATRGKTRAQTSASSQGLVPESASATATGAKKSAIVKLKAFRARPQPVQRSGLTQQVEGENTVSIDTPTSASFLPGQDLVRCNSCLYFSPPSLLGSPLAALLELAQSEGCMSSRVVDRC